MHLNILSGVDTKIKLDIDYFSYEMDIRTKVVKAVIRITIEKIRLIRK